MAPRLLLTVMAGLALIAATTANAAEKCGKPDCSDTVSPHMVKDNLGTAKKFTESHREDLHAERNRRHRTNIHRREKSVPINAAEERILSASLELEALEKELSEGSEDTADLSIDGSSAASGILNRKRSISPSIDPAVVDRRRMRREGGKYPGGGKERMAELRDRMRKRREAMNAGDKSESVGL